MDRSSIYTGITGKIVAALEEGTVPWKRPWKLSGGYPVNVRNGRRYRGINTLILMLSGFSDPRWGTYKAIGEAGGQVRKGEKATTIVLWKPVAAKENEGGERVKDGYMLMRTYPVFNATQADGLPDLLTEERAFTPIETADAIVRGYVWELGSGNSGPPVMFGYDRAAYSPGRDEVYMPEAKAFVDDEAFYATLFHELTHSTGSEKRLGRIESSVFGTDPYAKEELVAEIGASFLSGIAELEYAGGEQSAAYIANWLERLTDDPSLIVSAAAQAQKAVDLIMGEKFAESEREKEPEEVTAV